MIKAIEEKSLPDRNHAKSASITGCGAKWPRRHQRRVRPRSRRYKSRMSEITKDTHATLHQLVAGEDTIKEEGRLGDLVLRYISLSSSQRPEYFIMIGQIEYLPKQIEPLGRSCGREGASRFVGTGVDAGDSNPAAIVTVGMSTSCRGCRIRRWDEWAILIGSSNWQRCPR